ncbi:tRNA lysidine(34) synthetase TilS [Candidatus Saccharibacteria bacterium]|nr:tRNA lysidine(34) synthetase TilS [Candidatus Saccharibacteria bacterium]
MNYVVAVSGGVDSIALLDMVALDEVQLPDVEQIIVAHFEHGIRDNSDQDAQFVEERAQHYGYQYEIGHGTLGKNTSEEVAREARYTFLRQLCKKYKATLVTAHHRDDVLETMIINLLRGTSWRGLASLQSSEDIFRPLLDRSKRDLLEYAKRHNLEWHEDSTNQDESYLRNYIRLTLIPKLTKAHPEFPERMLAYNAVIAALKPEIQSEIDRLVASARRSSTHLACSRYTLIMWPRVVSTEYLYAVLTRLDPHWHPERHHIERSLNFIKTAQNGSMLKVGKSLSIVVGERLAEFKNT